MSSEHVAAVVVTYNRLEVLRRGLGAIFGQSRPPDSVCVVDNASADGTEDAVAREFPAADYLRLPENLGFAAGLAAGMRRWVDQGADYLWLLDDDSLPAVGALDRLLHAAARPPRLAAVGLDGGSLRLGVPQHGRCGPSLVAAPGDPVVRACDFLLLDGALVSRTAVAEVGYPRADFFMMMEDVEYTGRMRRGGLALAVLEEGLIRRDHLGSGGGGGGGSSPPWRGYYQTRNHLRMAIERRSAAEMAGWVGRQVKLVWGCLMAGDRKRERLGLRALGAWHGVLGVSGRTVDPAP